MPKAHPALARYLFDRLRHVGVGHVYGVPGDFTLRALDHLNASGLRFVGCCNELNAGYAADGYARMRRWQRPGGGLGALITTYGVGELSAANAVAGSYAEHVPLVHLVGTPSQRALRTSATGSDPARHHLHIHHTMGDGRAGVFREIAAKFTVAQLNLAEVELDDVPKRVDWLLSQALEQSRPVYLELPTDKVDVQLATGAEPFDDGTNGREEKNDHNCQVASNALLQRLYAAKRPMILVDRGEGVEEMRDDINEFVRRTGLPTLTLPSGLGMVDNELPNYFGVHSGKIGLIDAADFVHSADLVLAFGPLFADTQTLGWGTVPERENMVIIGKGRVDDTPVNSSREVIRSLLSDLDVGKLTNQDTTPLGNFRLAQPAQVSPEGEVDQTNFYLKLGPHLQPDDTVILGNATPIIGGRDLVLPPSSNIIASGMWFSIGHMLPAALGAAQAKAKGRTILLDGDGSFQVTAQELSTIIHKRVDMVVFIINNGGYTYERWIHGKDEEYNEIAPWDYLAAPKLFGEAPEGYPVRTHRVRTWKDLDVVLNSEEFRSGKGLTLVDVIMDKFDVSERARVIFEHAGKQLK